MVLYHHVLKMKIIRFLFFGYSSLFAAAAFAQSHHSENPIDGPDNGLGDNSINADTEWMVQSIILQRTANHHPSFNITSAII